MPDHCRLAVLTQLRKAAGVTLAQMAHACGLHGKRAYESAAAWERGESVPRPSVRHAFLVYLAHTLNLAADRATLAAVWNVAVEEWGWEPLHPADWAMIDQGLSPLPVPEGHAHALAPGVSTFAVQERHSAPVPNNDPHALALPLNAVPDPGPLPPGSVLPFAPHPHFIGRTTELLALAQLFLSFPQIGVAPGQHAAHDQAREAYSSAGSALRAALTGPRGIGKTQLAIEFAHRFGRFFPGGVFWVSFANAETVPAGMAICGAAMSLHPRFDRLSFKDQAQLVTQAWGDNIARLLIFDDCEDEALLNRWLPQRGASRVLVTSQRATWEQRFGLTLLPLRALSRAQSVELLRKHCPLAHMRDEELVAIAAELDDLPLALNLAGRHLSRSIDALTPAHYLHELRQSLAVHERAGERPSRHTTELRGQPTPPTGHLNHFQMDQMHAALTDPTESELVQRGAATRAGH